MEHDDLFRLIMLVGIVTVLPIGLYHRLQSQKTREKLDRRQEGLLVLLTLRPLALVRMIGAAAWLINPQWMSWSAVGLPVWIRWCGVGFGVAAAGLLVWVFRALGQNITDTVVTRKNHSLVTTGPYRWVRHPFYLAFALAITADSLVTANWFLAVTGALAFLLIMIRTVREEENLVKRFGDDYRRYQQTTGALVPRLRRSGGQV